MSRSHKIWIEVTGGTGKSFGIGQDDRVKLDVYVGTSATNSEQLTRIKFECHEDENKLHFYVNIDGQDYRLTQFDRKTKEFAPIRGWVIDGSPEAEQKRQEEATASLMRMTGAVMAMGEIFADTQEQKNDWKARMLRAGLDGKGLIMPEDWDTLSEDEKTRRLDAVIETLH